MRSSLPHLSSNNGRGAGARRTSKNGRSTQKETDQSEEGRRLTSYKLKPVHAAVCPRCRSAKLPHAACPQCGYYRGRQVVHDLA